MVYNVGVMDVRNMYMLSVMSPRSELEYCFFQAEDGIRDRSPSRGLGDVYKRQILFVVVLLWSFLVEK